MVKVGVATGRAWQERGRDKVLTHYRLNRYYRAQNRDIKTCAH